MRLFLIHHLCVLKCNVFFVGCMWSKARQGTIQCEYRLCQARLLA